MANITTSEFTQQELDYIHHRSMHETPKRSAELANYEKPDKAWRNLERNHDIEKAIINSATNRRNTKEDNYNKLLYFVNAALEVTIADFLTEDGLSYLPPRNWNQAMRQAVETYKFASTKDGEKFVSEIKLLSKTFLMNKKMELIEKTQDKENRKTITHEYLNFNNHSDETLEMLIAERFGIGKEKSEEEESVIIDANFVDVSNHFAGGD